MNAFFYDTHAHLTGEALLEKAELLIQEAYKTGVMRILVIATDSKSLTGALKLQGYHPEGVRIAAARTPHDVAEEDALFFDEIVEAASQGKLVAIGETGLDKYNAETPLELQKQWMRRYLKLAQQMQLPIILHCRNAFPELIEILDQEYRDESGGYGKRGVLHCFTGTAQEAQELIARGFYLSISGIVTYKNNQDFRDIVRGLPLDRLLIETDCPYLAPQSRRGKVNEPAFVVETAACVAQLHQLPLNIFQQIATNNALTLFGK